jgi:hypothetical protein
MRREEELMRGIPQAPMRHGHRHVTLLALGLLAALTMAGSAVAASNGIHIKTTKKQITITGTAAASGDSVQVNFDPHKCAASYSQEDKRTGVAFTSFDRLSAGRFKETIKLPIAEPTGDKPAHYACAYLLEIVKGTTIKPVASASRKY